MKTNQRIRANDNQLRILLIGAGGIGGITAARIARAGYNIEVVDNLPGLAGRINEKGIHVFGGGDDFYVKIRAYKDIKDVGKKKDVIMIATKANSLPVIIESIKPLMKEDSVIVSLQNGFCEEALSLAFGDQRVVGCVVGWGATVHEPGELEMTSGGDFRIGRLNGKAVNHFDAVKNILETTAPVACSDNIKGCLYSKLIINSCITTMGAVCGLTLGDMLIRRKLRNIFIGVIREAVSVGKAKGVDIEKYAEKLDFYDFADRNTRLVNFKKHLLILIIGMKYRKLRSSSLQSLQTGRKTEIDFLNGYIADNARKNGIDTPLNNYLVRLVKEIEDEKRSISLSNFNMDLFNQFN